MNKRKTWIQSGFYLTPRIWYHFPISKFELRVLHGLAYFADYDSGRSWPAIEKLAAVVRCSRSRLQKALRSLEWCRAIIAEERPGHSTVYRLNDYAIVSDRKRSTITVSIVAEGGDLRVAPQSEGEVNGGDLADAPGASYGSPGGVLRVAHNKHKNKNIEQHHADAGSSPRKDDGEELVKELSSLGVTVSVANGLVRKYPADRIRRQLKWFKARGRLENPPAAIVAAIRDDWPKPRRYREPTQYPDLAPDLDPEPGSPEYERVKQEEAERKRTIDEAIARHKTVDEISAKRFRPAREVLGDQIPRAGSD